MHPLALMQASLHPDVHLLVGFEDDDDGSLRVYLDARYLNLHTHTEDEDVKNEVRGAPWGSTTITVPADALCDCPAPEATP